MFESPSSLDAAPGPGLAAALEGRVWDDADDADLIEALVATEQLTAWAAGIQVEILSALARRRPPDPHDRSQAARGLPGSTVPAAPITAAADAGPAMDAEQSADDQWVRGPLRYSTFTADEVAAALGWSWSAASNRLRVAVDLSTRLPRVADALHAGQLDWPRARAISEATRGLGGEAAWRVADQGLRAAAHQPVGRLRDPVTRAALAADPTLAARRHTKARSERAMVHQRAGDGMALFGAVMPAADAALAAGSVDALARASLAPDDPRTLEQARVDAFTDTLILGCGHHPPGGQAAAPPAAEPERDRRPTPGSSPPGAGRGHVAAVVNITVPMTTLFPAQTRHPDPAADPTPDPATDPIWWGWALLGVDPARLPGEVGRAGPVAAEQAVSAALAALAGGAPVRWVATDPAGRAVAATVATHRRPAWMDDAVRVADRTCRAPGCRRPAESCDSDHAIPYPRGSTGVPNLAALCRHHHRMKTHTRWRYRLRPDRTVEWTSPTGRSYTTHPDRWLPPLEPPSWLDDPDPDADPGESATDWGAGWVADEADPPWLQACGPDTHPLLGLPWPDPTDADPMPNDGATSGAGQAGSPPTPDPWAPADPGAEDALEQDDEDWRLYATVFGR